MSYNRRFQQNQFVDNIRGKSPMASVFKSSSLYPCRPGEPDCRYYLRTGSCGYGSNCRFNHPVYDAQGDQYRERLPERIRQPNCLYFLRTGTCKYGSTCKYRHPNYINGDGRVTSNIRGLPMRQDQMAEQSEVRRWDELFPEALELIFSYLSLKQLLTVIPCICKYWRNVVTAPGCWQEIDIEKWSKYCKPRHVDQMLRMLITRSNGSLRKLCVSGRMKDATFSFITENASSLQVLRLPGSKIKGSIVEKNAQKLSTITLLDLSCCKKIGAKALVAIGKHCKLLVTLLYNMEQYNYSDTDAQANAIAATMPGLKHLEMANHEISSESVMKIIFGCPQLEYLNIRHCCEVELDFGFLKEKFPKLTIFGPYTLEDCIDSDFDTDSDFDPWHLDYLDYDDYANPFHPDYLDYDDYTDPFHSDYHQNDDY